MVSSIKDNMEIDGSATISMHESNKDDKTFKRYIIFIHAERTLCLKIIYCMLLCFDTKNWPLLKAGGLQYFDIFSNHNLH